MTAPNNGRQPILRQRQEKRKRRVSPAILGSLWAVILLVSGCQGTYNGFLRPVGPDYCRPKTPVADQWVDSDDQRVISEQADHSQWWRTFNDPVLDELIAMAYSQNIPLRAAGLRVLEARSQAAIARGNLMPQLQELFGGYERIRVSENFDNNVFADKFVSQWQSGFNASWELDFWGRFRRAIEAADADVDASIENYDDVLVILLAEIAATYVEIRTFEQRLQYRRSNVEIQEESLKLAEIRFNGGQTSELDPRQAESNLGQTESIVPVLESARRQAENRLCVLLGIPPQNVQQMLGGPNPIPTAPPQVVVGIPADLLRRRPDVRRAEREAAAQSARIGIAASDLYPRIAVSGFIGLHASDFDDLLESQSTFGSIGPSFRWNIWNYGRIRNNIVAQEARFQQLVAQYQETVLQANAEVENNLIAFLKAQQTTESLRRAVKATERSAQLARTQYNEGLIDFDRVNNVLRTLTAQQDLLAQGEGSIAGNLVRVYKALGGGWEIRLGGAPLERLPSPPEMIEGEEALLPAPLPPDEPSFTPDA